MLLKAVMDSNVRRQFKVALRLILLTLVRKSELRSLASSAILPTVALAMPSARATCAWLRPASW
jgi:hypothetical protein